MSSEKGITRVGHFIGILAGLLIGAFIFIINRGYIKAIIFGLIGFVITWGLVRLITYGIVWIVKGFKEK